VQAWLAPIRSALAQLVTGEVDCLKGYPVTTVAYRGGTVARIDHCINGFTAMLARLAPSFPADALNKVSKKLETGVLLTMAEVEAAIRTLNESADLILGFTRRQLKDVALVEQINIEMEMKGLKS
jgi:hypothetical protein